MKFISIIALLSPREDLMLLISAIAWNEYKQMHQHHAPARYLERIRDQYKQMLLLPESAYDTCKMETKWLTRRLRLKATL